MTLRWGVGEARGRARLTMLPAVLAEGIHRRSCHRPGCGCSTDCSPSCSGAAAGEVGGFLLSPGFSQLGDCSDDLRAVGLLGQGARGFVATMIWSS